MLIEPKLLSQTLSSAHDLMDITNDILVYSSNEDPAAHSNPEHFSLRDLTSQLAQQLAALAAPKGLEAVVDLIEPVPPALFGNMIRIRQVVNNLLSNAVKYTEQGHVSLSVGHQIEEGTGRSMVCVSVIDTGIGISRETLGQVFETYARAAEVYQASIEGTGLGLAIARQLATDMNGTLTVESEPGVGSHFKLTVPVETGDPAQIVERREPVPLHSFGLELLVIEDHPVNRMVLRGYLERMGCSVSESEAGQQGLLMAETGDFDLILIDLDLPDMDGAAVAARLNAAGTRAVLAAVTAHTLDDSPDERHRLGVARILSKPVSPHVLSDLLAYVAARSRPLPPRMRCWRICTRSLSILGPRLHWKRQKT